MEVFENRKKLYGKWHKFIKDNRLGSTPNNYEEDWGRAIVDLNDIFSEEDLEISKLSGLFKKLNSCRYLDDIVGNTNLGKNLLTRQLPDIASKINEAGGRSSSRQLRKLESILSSIKSHLGDTDKLPKDLIDSLTEQLQELKSIELEPSLIQNIESIKVSLRQ